MGSTSKWTGIVFFAILEDDERWTYEYILFEYISSSQYEDFLAPFSDENKHPAASLVNQRQNLQIPNKAQLKFDGKLKMFAGKLNYLLM